MKRPQAPRRTITIRIGEDGEQSQRIGASIYGNWAVHTMPYVVTAWPHLYDVTHIPTGANIAPYATELKRSDAVRVARALDAAGVLSDRTINPITPDRQYLDEDRFILQAIVGRALDDEREVL